MTKSITTTPRYLALAVLDRVQRGAYSNLQLNSSLQKANNDADRRLITNLVYGVLQHRLTLDYYLAPLVHQNLDDWVHALLLMSVYQYQYLDRVPAWAVTNEAIKIARFRGNAGIRRFVTGVLHAYLKQGPRDLKAITDPIQYWSIKESVPEWLVKELEKQYGKTQMMAILSSINQPAKISVRVNTSHLNVDAAQAQLAKEGIETTPSKVAQDGLIVDKGDLLHSAAFQNGLVTVQDESAMLAVEAMQLNGDETVLDACAAPGGKTGQIAACLAKGKGRVTALDIHPHKVQLIMKNMQRLGLAEVVDAQALDARKVDSTFADESFDRILVDAPCSGIGLMRRKPEIRYDKTLADSQHLHKIQLAILRAIAPKVKKGGIITYSTCTILGQENDATVQAFLKEQSSFKLLKVKTKRAIKSDRHSDTLTILPSDYGSDGFFIASLKRMK
ncbi:16S rRNA (cytosine(967)-C(5))-methyltransferase RsmB [Limosilactobacillus secaliphilus]|uniref:16S rRNA (cytosine(967)-C(5))-methyltransferase RsmB n=1 Tax=Limosilactobacillus secaliphilus TaxID=396268 RepID=UPI000708B36A|nr:16S rRNA (cytosine(967)-C(5))-methyltransferase RsmB [Limosilactobacillus secaliphilus]